MWLHRSAFCTIFAMQTEQNWGLECPSAPRWQPWQRHIEQRKARELNTLMLSRRSFVASSLPPLASFVPPSYRQARQDHGFGCGGGRGWCRNQLAAGVPGLQCHLPGAGRYEDYAKSPAADPKWELLRQREYNPDPNVRNRAEDYPIDVREKRYPPPDVQRGGGQYDHVVLSCPSISSL